MTSQSINDARGTKRALSTKDARDETIFAAVRASVILHGVRRTTANDIAERAGISRMTFYRAMGSVDEAVLRTLTREFTIGTERARAASQGSTARDRLVDFAVASVHTFATSPLMRSIGERDPEMLIPYVTDRFGSSQAVVLSALEDLLAEGRADGSIDARPSVATSILLTMRGFALSSRIVAARGELDSCLDELRILLTAYLSAPDARASAQASP